MLGEWANGLIFSTYGGEEMSMGDAVLKVLSLFSGCGGLDLGLEGGFISHVKSVGDHYDWVERSVGGDWVELKRNRFTTVFANDILPFAQRAWQAYMQGRGRSSAVYHLESIVNLVRMEEAEGGVFPAEIDVVTGGFPCQDFSVAGRRRGFGSVVNHDGSRGVEVSVESRGMLYYWMKRVIDLTRPKLFIAENVKGLTTLGDALGVIRQDFSSAAGDGYHVVQPRVLNACCYGVPQSRERVIFIGIRHSALREGVLERLQAGDTSLDLYPQPTHGADGELPPYVLPLDVFADLHEPNDTRDFSQMYYSKAKYLGNRRQGQTEVRPDRLSPTIRSEHHGNIEYRRLSPLHGGVGETSARRPERRLTPRECALIQTFPPDYPFVIPSAKGQGFEVSPSSAYKIIGNAVPPMLGYNIGRRLQEVWRELFK